MVPTLSRMTLLCNMNIPGLILDSFNFDKKIKLPDDITHFQLLLAVCIHKNAAIEESNNTSILETVSAKNASTPRLVN